MSFFPVPLLSVELILAICGEVSEPVRRPWKNESNLRILFP